MIIKIAPAVGNATTLIDGAYRVADKTSGPTELSGAASVPVSQRLPLRRAAGRPIQRGGATHPTRFSGSRMCASAAAAHIWLYGHLAACPRGGTLQMIEGTTTISIADAVVQDIAYRFQGSTVLLDYTCTGGAVTVATT